MKVNGKVAPHSAIFIQEVGRWSDGSGAIVTIKGNGPLLSFGFVGVVACCSDCFPLEQLEVEGCWIVEGITPVGFKDSLALVGFCAQTFPIITNISKAMGIVNSLDGGQCGGRGWGWGWRSRALSGR